MPELTPEEEFLAQLSSAGVLGIRLLRLAFGLPDANGESAGVKALKAAGYQEQTPFDEQLRRALGEQSWAMYVADKPRVLCAALITDGDKAGHDMTALLSKAASWPAWEDGARSPARSIALVLAFRIKNELDKGTFRRAAPAASPAPPPRPQSRSPVR
jgi:hypothetical protein